MKLFRIHRFSLLTIVCLTVGAAAGIRGLTVAAAGETAPDVKDAPRPAAEASDDKADAGSNGAADKTTGDGTSAEEKNKAEVLLDKLHALNRKEPAGDTRDEKIDAYRKIQREMIETAGQLYGLSEVDEEDGMTYAAVAAQVTVRSLRTLQQLGDEQAKAELEKFAELIAKDKRPQISQFGKRLEMDLKYEFSVNASDEEVIKIAALLKKDFGEGEIPLQNAALVLEILNRIEQAGHSKAALDLNRFFSERFADSKNEKLVEAAERLAGAARRLDLPGNAIEVSGVFLDGSKVDWASYRGKVVLLDYWATWCGPCIAELPNLLEHYEIYHDRGFEVIGISIDEDRELVDKFLEERELPWKTLFGDKPESTGWNHPMAKYYGIGGIPTVILVNKEGNVVSLNARGNELGRLLAELIGPPEEGDTAP
ncbi:MAG: TlpA disulfide reductase family protein [Pirellulales bacterium]|nr:TlpA disulfide reductase family protein [Pirellulales bacterium]